MLSAVSATLWRGPRESRTRKAALHPLAWSLVWSVPAGLVASNPMVHQASPSDRA